jgi:hypothetical protein
MHDVVEQINHLPVQYAAFHPNLLPDRSVPNLSHPLLLQTFKPIRTTGDGNCLYHALSLALTGSEQISYLLKMVVAHALLKCRAAMISAFHDAFLWGAICFKKKFLCGIYIYRYVFTNVAAYL